MTSHIVNSEKIIEEIPFEEILVIQDKSKILSDFQRYLMDESKLVGETDRIFFPKSESEIASILNFLRKNDLKGCISAARTGIVGSCVPSEDSVLSTENMKKVLGFGYDDDKKNYFIRVEPGITLTEIDELLHKKQIENIIELTPNAKHMFEASVKSYHYPVDPTEMSSTIGGNVATNASGANTLKYGPTREWIKGLRVMLSNGEILDIQRGKYFASNENSFMINQSNGYKLQIEIPNYIFNTSVKNAAGIYSKPHMDLIDLFIGSEGILGIITQIDIWITEKSPIISNILFFHSEDDAITFVELIRDNKVFSPEFLEFFSAEALNLMRNIQNKDPSSLKIPEIPMKAKSAIFFDLPYSEDNLDQIFEEINHIAEKCNTDLSNGWSGYEIQDLIRFKHFRHALPETVNAIIAERKLKFPQLHKLGTDMSVPEKYFRKMMSLYHSILKKANLEYVIYGHIGNNHVHVNILPKNMEDLHLGEKIYKRFAQKAVSYGGSVSAEHGIGKIKKEYLKVMYSHDELKEMRRIKKLLDPSLILNCGNIIDFNTKE